MVKNVILRLLFYQIFFFTKKPERDLLVHIPVFMSGIEFLLHLSKQIPGGIKGYALV